MSTALTIVLLGLTVYGLRLAGLMIPRKALPYSLAGALEFVPAALLSALLASLLLSHSELSMVRVAAIAIAGLVVWQTNRSWSGILAGLMCYWLLFWTG